MQFAHPLQEAVLIQRYKRFLADVRLPDGDMLTVHCPNPGAMMGLNDPGNRCWISDSHNPKRKLRHTLELVEAQAPEGPVLVGMNTMLPNKLAREAIEAGRIPELSGYDSIRPEVPYSENSRIDMLLEHPDRRPCYVEVKNVHLVRELGLHEFPDCKTARGAKHLDDLTGVVAAGGRAVMLYIIQRSDGDRMTLAADLDRNYAEAFIRAQAAGVEAIAIRCEISTTGIEALHPVQMIAPELS
ncbi:DNA/RNA nuclease SfsA [Ahrensia sp. R2A130]|uniref:DNA/RNA nuclease SfsA n=1 Tax=Ahrensia sp. R2A130 TaxID=744979 RepID=UPI0001E0BC0D|nr:DNA/RNA nuclease SfsA [Ahrensia sp. R2A130]EFL90160.1 sugar fermentation stimulation protein [Ahrensia sp. R2A130]